MRYARHWEDGFCASTPGFPTSDGTRRSCALKPTRSACSTFLVRTRRRARVSCLDGKPTAFPILRGKGHEVATHGYGHVLLTRMTPEDFACDLRHALEVTQPLLRQPILGFRAPSFTITSATVWAYDIRHLRGDAPPVFARMRELSTVAAIASFPRSGSWRAMLRKTRLSVKNCDAVFTARTMWPVW